MIRQIQIASCLVMLLLGTFTGCGKLSDPQQQDVANIVGGVGGANSGKGTYLAEPVVREEIKPDFMGLINQQIDSALWMSKFRLEAGDHSALTVDQNEALAPFSCSSSTVSGCTFTCPSASTFKIACTDTVSSSNTCAGTAYTFGNKTVAVTLDVTSVTGSGTSATGNLILNLAFSADVSGGNLSGKTLACNIGLTFDVAKVKATTPQKPTLDCSNFTCTYDGKNVECAKLQADFGTSMSCT
jgi:hypothetical protein